jgi:hypothetical protein
MLRMNDEDIMSKKNSTPNPTDQKKSTKKTRKINPDSPVAEAPVQETPMTAVETPAVETETSSTESGPRTYSLIRVSKFGFALYRVAGIRGTVAISKSMFAGDPPATVEVNVSNWAAVGAQTAVRTPSPEKIEKMKASIAKTEALNAKRRAKLEKYGVALETPESVDAPAEAL